MCKSRRSYNKQELLDLDDPAQISGRSPTSAPETRTLGRGDFRKNFRIFLGMIVSSWVIEIGWLSIFSGLKMEFSPWHKFQFSSEHIYLRENNKAFGRTDCIKILTEKQEYQSVWVIELSRFCMILLVKFIDFTYNMLESSRERNFHWKQGFYLWIKTQ